MKPRNIFFFQLFPKFQKTFKTILQIKMCWPGTLDLGLVTDNITFPTDKKVFNFVTVEKHYKIIHTFWVIIQVLQGYLYFVVKGTVGKIFYIGYFDTQWHLDHGFQKKNCQDNRIWRLFWAMGQNFKSVSALWVTAYRDNGIA